MTMNLAVVYAMDGYYYYSDIWSIITVSLKFVIQFLCVLHVNRRFW